jgi:hypothetical protein
MSPESSKTCLNCQLVNPKSALRCDCGYDFASGKIEKSYLTPEQIAEAEAERERRESDSRLSLVEGPRSLNPVNGILWGFACGVIFSSAFIGAKLLRRDVSTELVVGAVFVSLVFVPPLFGAWAVIRGYLQGYRQRG